MHQEDETLKEKCNRLRSVADYKLEPNSYIIIFCDGKNFSRKIKNKFEKPFDKTFVEAMNKTMEYLCDNIQGCKYAYCQSDEISLVISDIPKDVKSQATSFFGYRLCKIQSIVASMAAGKFTTLMTASKLKEIPRCASGDDILDMAIDTINNAPLYEFDCKAWNVPNANDAYAWFLYRQLDCIRNSKQQAAQTYLPHKELLGKHTDEQVRLLLEKCGIDWNDYDDGVKFGRVCYKKKVLLESPEYGSFERNKWFVSEAEEFAKQVVKDDFINKISNLSLN